MAPGLGEREEAGPRERAGPRRVVDGEEHSLERPEDASSWLPLFVPPEGDKTLRSQVSRTILSEARIRAISKITLKTILKGQQAILRATRGGACSAASRCPESSVSASMSKTSAERLSARGTRGTCKLSHETRSRSGVCFERIL